MAFYDSFDVAVCGGGHAGIEASLACARMGLKTILITQSIDSIGRMSCNPSIGGIAKGNIVREIDALGGAMGRLIDRSMIQFRMLNKSRGPAVQAPRSQADKIVYSSLARHVVETMENLSTLMDTVVDVLTEHARMAVEETGMKKLAIAGGVASNSALRQAMKDMCEKNHIDFYYPSPILCTDNAAMIGAAAYYEFLKGVRHGLDLNAIPNLKLGER